MAFQAENIKIDEHPTGNLSNIGHSLLWFIESRDLLIKGSLFSQIFDAKDHPCRASITFNVSLFRNKTIEPLFVMSTPPFAIVILLLEYYSCLIFATYLKITKQ